MFVFKILKKYARRQRTIPIKPETKESFKLPPKSRVNVEAEIKYPNIFILRGYSFSSAILLSFFSASSIETLLKATSLERLFNLAILSKLIVLLVTLLVLEIAFLYVFIVIIMFVGITKTSTFSIP